MTPDQIILNMYDYNYLFSYNHNHHILYVLENYITNNVYLDILNINNDTEFVRDRELYNHLFLISNDNPSSQNSYNYLESGRLYDEYRTTVTRIRTPRMRVIRLLNTRLWV